MYNMLNISLPLHGFVHHRLSVCGINFDCPSFRCVMASTDFVWENRDSIHNKGWMEKDAALGTNRMNIFQKLGNLFEMLQKTDIKPILTINSDKTANIKMLQGLFLDMICLQHIGTGGSDGFLV